jgi:hypothetical protein
MGQADQASGAEAVEESRQKAVGRRQVPEAVMPNNVDDLTAKRRRRFVSKPGVELWQPQERPNKFPNSEGVASRLRLLSGTN